MHTLKLFKKIFYYYFPLWKCFEKQIYEHPDLPPAIKQP